MNIKKLEQWYIKNHTDFVFRKTTDPYRIWISEIMLQQTQLETVIPYYKQFLSLYPDVFALAKTTDNALKKCVEGIGYYRRFKYMKKAAQKIIDDFSGIFPSSYDDVLSLPGVGIYTAGAIMSIAYNKPYGAVDGNVIRILSRQLNQQEDMRQEKNKHIIRNINQTYIEQAHPRVYTQALMDLGRTVCKPKQPLCTLCPIAETCQAYDMGIQSTLPFMSKLKAVKEIHYIVLIIYTKTGLIVRKRTDRLLEGMYEYPQYESESITYVMDMLEEQGVMIDVMNEEPFVTHIFTHQKWLMRIFTCKLIGEKIDPSWDIYSEDDIKNIPMARAHRKLRR